jgi:hypothetical protein
MGAEVWYPMVVLAPVAGLAAYCVSQIAVARIGRHRNPYVALATGFLVGLLATLACSAFFLAGGSSSTADAWGLLLLNLVTYLALAFGYFNFVNLGIASLRIRMLEELRDAGGRAPMNRLLTLYNSDVVASVRIQRLVAGGHLVEHDGHLSIGHHRFLAVARIFDLLRWLIIGRPEPRRSETSRADSRGTVDP